VLLITYHWYITNQRVPREEEFIYKPPGNVKWVDDVLNSFYWLGFD